MRLSLQGKFLLVASLGMAVLVGAFGFLAISTLRENTDRALAERLVLARVVASRLDLILEQSLARVEKYSQREPLEGQDCEALQRLFYTARHELPLLPSYMTLVDRRGTVVCTAPYFAELIGVDVSSFAHVRAALDAGRASISGVRMDARGRYVVYLASPVRNLRGEVAGLIQAAVDLANSNIGEFVLPLALGETGYAEVVDRNGIVLASSQHGRLFEKGDHSDQFAALIKQGRTTAGTCHDCHTATAGGGRRREVLAFAPLSSAPWGLAIRQSEEEALAPVRQLQNKMLLVGLLALLVVGSFSWVGVRRIVRPLLVLAAASRRIGEGVLDAPVPQVGEEEIRILSRALEEMRQKLGASYGEMARYQKQLEGLAEQRGKELRALLKASESLTYATDHEALLESIVRAAVETFRGADMGALFLYDRGSGELVMKSAVGYDLQALAQVRLKPGEALVGRVFELQKPLVCHTPAEAAELLEGATSHNRFYLMAARRGQEPLSMVSVPLQSRGQVIGSLLLTSLRHPYAFPESEVEVLSAFAAHAAIALENARLMGEAAQALAFQEASRLKSEFLSSISHDLRTPVTSIKICVESLLAAKRLGKDGARARLLLNISRNTDHLNRLVGDLIDMARLQSGILKLNAQSLDLREVISDSVDTMRPLVEARNQVLRVKVPVNISPVMGDRARLKQVLVNLLTNATDYTPDGGAITVAAEERDSYIIVSVADTGPGIPPSEQAKLFERFYRSSGGERSRRGGLGLGLPIAQALVELHGGQIWLKSEVGRGSTFFFSLPKEGTQR